MTMMLAVTRDRAHACGSVARLHDMYSMRNQGPACWQDTQVTHNSIACLIIFITCGPQSIMLIVLALTRARPRSDMLALVTSVVD